MAKLTWSGERYRDWDDGGKWKDAPPVTLDLDMKEADFSNKHLGVSGAIILAAFIKRKSFQDNGALAKLDLSKNDLRSEGLKSLSEVLNSTSIAQLNLANNNLNYNAQVDSDMSGVIKFAQDIQDNGALVSLNLANNRLGAEGAKHLATALPYW